MHKLVMVSIVTACGVSPSSGSLPLISPPVRAALPQALEAPAPRVQAFDATLSPGDLHDWFFSGSGPTDLMTVLGWVDDRLVDVGGTAGASCLADAPVPVAITAVGAPAAMLDLPAQCYRDFGGDAFMQFAVVGGTTSIYVAAGQVHLAAVISPDSVVDAYFGVGYTNASTCGTTGTFDDCSYGVTSLHADPSTHAFELAVAGLGEGYCGVQLVSDGTSVYAVGSGDMGETCNVPATLCADATDLASPGTCDALAPTLPAIGRRAGAGAHVFGASAYPDTPNVTLDGTATDSLGFGPSAPTPGVASI